MASMSTAQVDFTIAQMQFNRTRTLGSLDRALKLPDPVKALGWRPGAGRAHIAWQFMHVAMTEELFATERLRPEKPTIFAELIPRFRGGSTVDDIIPTADEIRSALDQSRDRLLATLQSFSDADLDWKPEALKARNLSFRDVLNILVWHESHHQGQAHITLNLLEAAGKS
jgi:uncharacterized damage-inducible protein DinB